MFIRLTMLSPERCSYLRDAPSSAGPVSSEGVCAVCHLILSPADACLQDAEISGLTETFSELAC